MTRSVRTCRLALILAGAVASILATAVLTCALLPSLSAEANVVATNPSPASVARGPIPGFGPCSTYAVHYGHLNGAMLARLKKFDLVILHPGSDITSTQVDELQAAGVIVLGYVSIGEEPPDAVPTVGDGCGPAYYAPGETCSVPGKLCCEVKDRHCEGAGVASYYLDEDRDRLPDVHGPWGSYYVDPANPYWRDRIRHCDKDADTSCSFYGTDYVINTLGCDGLFLDTVDTASPWHPYYYTLDSMTETICTLSDLYPAKYIVINRGIFFAAPEYGADEVRPCINGIVFENYYSEWYWEGDEGRISPWFPDNRDVWAPKLITQANMPDGYAVFALDYLSPSQHVSIAHQINETAVRWGWIDYISTPSLDTIRWEAWEHSHRLVNTTDDELNSDGDCSLREAIQAANTDAAVDVCVTGTNGDIINLPTGTYTLTLGGAGEDANLTGDLDITDTHALVIIGAGSDKTVINANGIDRVFDIRPGAGTVVIKGVTILNGSVTNDNGGGTYDADADLILINTTISGNTATGSWPYAKGGGVYVSSGSVTLSGGQIKNNFAGQGGGVFVEQGRAMLSGGQIVNNTVSGNGGGMYIYQGRAMVSRGQIISNTAGFYGGGVYIAGTANTLFLTNTVIADNQANTAGSGLHVDSSSPHLVHTTIARNNGGDGSGVYVRGTGSNVALTNTILVSHTVGITVAAGNTAILNGVLWYSNAVNYGGGGAIIVTNEYTGNPAFATDGYHLSRASAAIDKGVNAGVKTDIDGQSRPVGWPDIGADEWGMWVYLPLVMRQFQLHDVGH